jgi:hypothetical protein
MAANQPVTFDFETDLGTYTFTADNAANVNRFWGDIASDLGNAGIMGEHTSAAGAFTPDPGDGGRTGVGNLSRDNPDFQNLELDSNTNLADGGQGLHGVYQAALLGSDELPPGIVEATLDPIVVESTQNIEVTFVPFPDDVLL